MITHEATPSGISVRIEQVQAADPFHPSSQIRVTCEDGSQHTFDVELNGRSDHFEWTLPSPAAGIEFASEETLPGLLVPSR